MAKLASSICYYYYYYFLPEGENSKSDCEESYEDKDNIPDFETETTITTTTLTKDQQSETMMQLT